MKQVKRRHSLLLPSIADILFLCIFLYYSFVEGMSLLADCDTGYHIRAGEYIIATLSIPRYDIFSYFSHPIPWTAHEWLSEVVMAIIHRAAGLTGIVVFFAFLIASVYYLLFKVVRTYNGNILVAILVVILAIASSHIHWLARPHIFSLLLMVAWYYILDTYQYNGRTYLYLLPLIMLLWVNLHGGFIAGFILIGVYLFGNLVSFFISPDAQREGYKEKTKLLGLATVACILVSMVNPYGYHILMLPFDLTSNRLILDNVSEYLSPNFHQPMPFKYLLFLMIAMFAITTKALNIIEIVLVLLFTSMSLYSSRFIPLFAIIVTPILVKQAEIILGQGDWRYADFLKKKSEDIVATDATTNGYVWPVVGILVAVIFVASNKIEYSFDKKKKPVAAVEFLKKEHLSGNMFNDDEFGDYIIYASWPGYSVFFDGRFLDADRMKDYLKVTRLKPGWDEVFKKYKIDWVIYDASSTLSLFLLERDEWKLIYADKVANIFIKNTPENQFLIKKYPDVKLILDEDSFRP